MKERMIERIFYALIMVALAKWGGIATGVAIEENVRADAKQERGDIWRSLYADALYEIETLKDNCPPERGD